MLSKLPPWRCARRHATCYALRGCVGEGRFGKRREKDRCARARAHTHTIFFWKLVQATFRVVACFSRLTQRRTDLQEMLSTDAPEELCDPITMTLFVDPVVSPSGETYSKDTVSRFDNGLCPARPPALVPSLTPTHTRVQV